MQGYRVFNNGCFICDNLLFIVYHWMETDHLNIFLYSLILSFQPVFTWMKNIASGT